MLMRKQLLSRRFWLREGSKNTIRINIMWIFMMNWTRKTTKNNSINSTTKHLPSTKPHPTSKWWLPSLISTTRSDLLELTPARNQELDRIVVHLVNTKFVIIYSSLLSRQKTLLIRWNTYLFLDKFLQELNSTKVSWV